MIPLNIATNNFYIKQFKNTESEQGSPHATSQLQAGKQTAVKQ